MLLLLLQITPEQRRNRQPTQKESSESIPRFIQYYRPLQREIGPYIYIYIYTHCTYVYDLERPVNRSDT